MSSRLHGEHTGPGDINWHSLMTVFSSEMLKFEEEQRILEEAANAALEEAAKALERPHTPPSRRVSGNMEQLSSPRGNACACQQLQDSKDALKRAKGKNRNLFAGRQSQKEPLIVS